MRCIDLIVIHCSATRDGSRLTYEQCISLHKKRGFRTIGYHYYIERDGTVHVGRKLDEIGAHAAPFNSHSVGICYEGGLDKNGKPKDTRTEEQKKAIRHTINRVYASMMSNKSFREVLILGHRDLSPDLDGDGEIQRHEWMKACPCFDAKEEYGFMNPWDTAKLEKKYYRKK